MATFFHSFFFLFHFAFFFYTVRRRGQSQITRFPHAVLEVKLEILEGMSTPAWVKEMLASGMAAEVYKFSKFIHGCAVLMQDDVQVRRGT